MNGMILYKIKARHGIRKQNHRHNLLSGLILTAFCLLCLPLLVSRAKADTPTSSRMNESSGYSADIYDEANLLTPEEEEQLLDTMFSVTRNGYAVLVTIDQNPVQSEVVYTNSFYKHHYGESENGAIMLIDMDLRILRLECYNRIEDFISANDSYTIVDNCYTLASAGRYADCAAKVFRQVSSLTSGMNIPRPVKYVGNALLAVLFASLISYCVVRVISKPQRAGLEELRRARYYNRNLYSVSHSMLSSKTVYSPISRGGGSSGGGHRGGGGGGGGHHSGGSHRF